MKKTKTVPCLGKLWSDVSAQILLQSVPWNNYAIKSEPCGHTSWAHRSLLRGKKTSRHLNRHRLTINQYKHSPRAEFELTKFTIQWRTGALPIIFIRHLKRSEPEDFPTKVHRPKSMFKKRWWMRRGQKYPYCIDVIIVGWIICVLCQYLSKETQVYCFISHVLLPDELIQ